VENSSRFSGIAQLKQAGIDSVKGPAGYVFTEAPNITVGAVEEHWIKEADMSNVVPENGNIECSWNHSLEEN